MAPEITDFSSPITNEMLQKTSKVQFDMEDMALWHQFITSTAATISRPWARDLPHIALTCDYLMYGILATSALHLAYLNPAKREHYELISLKYQHKGIGPYKEAIQRLSQDNCVEIFAFATLMVVFYYASLRTPEEAQGISTNYSGFSSFLACLKGCAVIFHQTKDYLKNSIYAHLAADDPFKLIREACSRVFPPSEDDMSLNNLQDILLNQPSIKSSTTVEEMDVYRATIEQLRKLFVGISHGTDTQLRRVLCSIWPMTVSDVYLRLLNEGRPPALLILGHYCLLLKAMEDQWYVHHRVIYMFEAIRNDLSFEWQPYLEYPIRVFDELKARSSATPSTTSSPAAGQESLMTPPDSHEVPWTKPGGPRED